MKARRSELHAGSAPSAIVVLRRPGIGPTRVSWSLRWYLVALTAAVMLPLLVLATVEALDAVSARRSEAALQMRLQLSETVQGVAQGLSSMTAVARVLASSPALALRDLGAFRLDAEEVAASYGVDVVLRDQSGAQRVATRVPRGAPLPTLPPEDRQARAAIEKGAQSFVSDVYGSGMTHPYLVRIVVPATLGSGDTLERGSMLELAIPPKVISAWLDASGLPPGWVVSVVGRNGQVIAHNGDPDRYAGRGSASDVFDPDGSWLGEDLDGGPITGVYNRLATGWTVAVGAPDSLLGWPIRLTFLRLGASAFILIVGGLALSVLLTRRIDRSAATLERAAKALGEGELVPPARLPVRDLAFVQDALFNAGRDLAVRQVRERNLLAEVRSARDLLQGVIDGSDDLIFARDMENRILLANQASAALFGMRSGAATVGYWLHDLLPRRQGANVESLTSTESGVATLDGRMFEVSHSRLRDASGAAVGTISIAREVTQRVAAEARLQRLQADLARAGRLSAVAAMSAGLAHELHQPLSAAANFLAVAMRRLGVPDGPGPAAAGVAEAMAEASGQVLRAGGIVQRLRGFIETGEMEQSLLAPLVREAAEAAWQHSGPAHGRMHMQLDDRAEALVDPVSIQQVVSNLVRNAADVLGAEGGDVWVVLEPAADGSAIVSVMDSGHGIDPTDADRLFDVFNGSSKQDGLGVGLAICRTIVAAHGGWIRAANHVGGGAAFMFSLPPGPTPLGNYPAASQRAA